MLTSTEMQSWRRPCSGEDELVLSVTFGVSDAVQEDREDAWRRKAQRRGRGAA